MTTAHISSGCASCWQIVAQSKVQNAPTQRYSENCVVSWPAVTH